MRAATSLGLLLWLSGCSVDRRGLGVPDDLDAGAPGDDAFMGPDLGIDAGAPPDAFVAPDVGVDAPITTCTPVCSVDGASAMTCTPTGMLVSSHCDRGCDAATSSCRPPTACPYTTVANITSGTMRFDLCGAGADDDHASTGSCGTSADGEDVVVRLEVDTAGSYRIDVVDVAGGWTVDTVLYVDTACDDSRTELACDDDSGAGLDSRLDIALDAGEYFVFVDSIDNQFTGDGCGAVDLTVTRM